VVTADSRSYEAAAGLRHHDHLVCRSCGRVVEFEYEAIEVLQREVAARHGFTLEGHHLQLVGRCADCAGAARAGGPGAVEGAAKKR
jgi:Fur family ferric uptake transcriptional regulator